jgi:hypothetical protein
VAEQVKEIPVEEYVEEVLTSPKEYQPKTERWKKAKRDALKEKGKKGIVIWLTNIPASLCSAKGVVDEYRTRWKVEIFFKEEKSYWYLNKYRKHK